MESFRIAIPEQFGKGVETSPSRILQEVADL
jgi:hypothetical protein